MGLQTRIPAAVTSPASYCFAASVPSMLIGVNIHSWAAPGISVCASLYAYCLNFPPETPIQVQTGLYKCQMRKARAVSTSNKWQNGLLKNVSAKIQNPRPDTALDTCTPIGLGKAKGQNWHGKNANCESDWLYWLTLLVNEKWSWKWNEWIWVTHSIFNLWKKGRNVIGASLCQHFVTWFFLDSVHHQSEEVWDNLFQNFAIFGLAKSALSFI